MKWKCVFSFKKMTHLTHNKSGFSNEFLIICNWTWQKPQNLHHSGREMADLGAQGVTKCTYCLYTKKHGLWGKKNWLCVKKEIAIHVACRMKDTPLSWAHKSCSSSGLISHGATVVPSWAAHQAGWAHWAWNPHAFQCWPSFHLLNSTFQILRETAL